MKLNKFSKDLIQVLFSNCFILMSSVVTGFVIPIVLGVKEYGYYKIFTLYLSYSALMHFGFVDGMLLKIAGKKYEELPKEKFRYYLRFFLIFQIIIACIVLLISNVFCENEYRYLMSLLAIDIIAVNVTAFYQYISQGVMRFKELSIRKILLAFLKTILVILLFCINMKNIKITANIYVTGLVSIDVLLTIWYMITYKDLILGQVSNGAECKSDIRNFFKEGIILTVAYQAASIIFSLDRQFVSILFDTETYGVYSFAYNIISMVTTVIGAVSFVLFPKLKQMNTSDIMNTFSTSMASIAIIAVGAMIGYQPLSILIKSFLPEYTNSLEYLKIIFPGLAMSCCINIIMFTYYKAINKHSIYFKICCFILIISACLNYFAYKLFFSPVYISMASIITLVIWYLAGEVYFIKKYKIKWIKNCVYILTSTIAFYSINHIFNNMLLAFLAYFVFYLLLTYILYKSLIYQITKKI